MPERRKVAGDARVSVAGVNYEVDPDLAGETVILWWGIFDNELYVEHGDKRFGPYAPVGGPIPLYRYRTFKKSPTQQRADRIEALAEQLALPRAALEGNPRAASLIRNTEEPVTMFTDPDPFQEFLSVRSADKSTRNTLAARRLFGRNLFHEFSASVEIQDDALALDRSTFWGLHAGNLI